MICLGLCKRTKLRWQRRRRTATVHPVLSRTVLVTAVQATGLEAMVAVDMIDERALAAHREVIQDEQWKQRIAIAVKTKSKSNAQMQRSANQTTAAYSSETAPCIHTGLSPQNCIGLGEESL